MRSVHGDVGEIPQDPGTAVGGGVLLEQVRSGFDERGGDPPRAEVVVGQNRLQERDVGGDAPDPELGDRTTCARPRGLQVPAATGQLHEHRVEVGADLGPQSDAPVQTDTRATGRAVGGDPPGVGPEAVGHVLGRDAALHCRAADLDRILGQSQLPQRRTGCDLHLGGDEIDVGDLLGDRVFHLDARVHLDEHVPTVGTEQELDGTGAGVPDVPGESHCIRTDPITDSRVERGCGGHLDDLLVAALERTVAFVEMDDLAGGVPEDLHLDVPGVDHRPLQEDRAVAEGRRGLARGRLDRPAQPRRLIDATHAAPATTGDRLDEQGETDRISRGHELVDITRRGRRGQHRETGLGGGRHGPGLVAGEFEHLGGRADEGDLPGRTRTGQLGVLGEKAVPGVHRISSGRRRDADHLVDREVRADRMPAFADLVGFERLGPMNGVAVLVGVDGHRARAELDRGTKSPYRDLASVRDQHLLEHGFPFVTGCAGSSHARSGRRGKDVTHISGPEVRLLYSQ